MEQAPAPLPTRVEIPNIPQESRTLVSQVERTVSAVCNGKISEEAGKVAQMKPAERTQYLTTHPQERALLNLKVLNEVSEQTPTLDQSGRVPPNQEVFDFTAQRDGKTLCPEVWVRNSRGERVRITRIIATNKDNFVCETVSSDGKTELSGKIALDSDSNSFSRIAVINAVLYAGRADILPLFQGAQQEVLSRYIDLVGNTLQESPKPIDWSTALEPDKTRALLVECAHEAGLPTIDDLEILVKKLEQSQKPPQAKPEEQKPAEGTAEQTPPPPTADNEDIARIKAYIERAKAAGEILVDPQEMANIFRGLVKNPDRINQMTQGAQVLIDRYRRANIVDKNGHVTAKVNSTIIWPDGTTTPVTDQSRGMLQNQLDEAEAVLKVYESAGNMDQLTLRYFQQLEAGQVPPDQARQVVQMIRENSMDNIVNLATADLDDQVRKGLLSEQDARNKKEQMGKFLRSAGIAGGSILGLLMLFSFLSKEKQH